LIVLHFLVNLHNDLIMAALIVLAFYLILRGRVVWALPALVAAGFVKYAAFAIAPFALAFVLRRYGRKAAIQSLLLSLAIGILVSVPYISELPSFKVGPVLTQFTESSGSLHAFLTFVFRAIAPIISSSLDFQAFSRFAGTLLWLTAGVFTLRQLAHAWSSRKAMPNEVADRWTSVLFAIVFIGSSQFYPWYIGMLLPLSVVGAGSSLLTDIVVMLSGTHLAFNFLRTRAIGYFLISTLVPVTIAVWHFRKRGRAICQ
jgi:hypothetical protein